MEFSVRAMKKKIKSQTGKRVSEDAANELGLLLENYGKELTEDAKKFAQDDGRQTIRDDDIKQALRNPKSFSVEQEVER